MLPSEPENQPVPGREKPPASAENHGFQRLVLTQIHQAHGPLRLSRIRTSFASMIAG